MAEVGALSGVPVDGLPVATADDLATTGPTWPDPERPASRVVVAAPSLAALRRALPLLDRAGTTHRLVLVVLASDRPETVGSPPAARAHLRYTRVVVHDGGAGGLVVEVRSRAPRPVADLVRRLVTTGRDRQHLGGDRVAVTSPSGLAWVAGDPLARWADAAGPVDGDPVPDDDPVPAVDVTVGHRPGAGAAAGSGAGSVVHLATGTGEMPTWERLARTPGRDLAAAVAGWVPPPVDEAVTSPLGFQADHTGEDLWLRRGGADEHATLAVDAAGRVVARLDPVHGVGEHDVAALRPYRLVHVDTRSAAGPLHLVVLLQHLATAGVPVHATTLPATVRRHLDPALTARFAELTPERADDPLLREDWSVTVRRHALTTLTRAARWHAARTGAAPAPEVSVLLATRRPDRLATALRQVAAQRGVAVETVLVLHGFGADHPDAAAALAAHPGRVVVLEVPAATVFGAALQAGLRRCGGTYVAKMDDDDWYGPYHLLDQVLALGYTAATVVGAKDYFTYLAGRDVTLRRMPVGPSRYTHRVAGGTVAGRRDDLLDVGGWAPVPRAVDRYLFAAVAAAGGLLHSTHGLGYCLLRGDDHTWQVQDEHFLASATDVWPGLVLPPQVAPDREVRSSPAGAAAARPAGA